LQIFKTKGYKIKKGISDFLGEIDIISEYKGNIVFVEVKTRSSNKFGYPEEAINYSKQQKYKKCFMLSGQIQSLENNCCFDVILISITNYKEIKRIKHIRNAFISMVNKTLI